jgi:integrase
VAGQLTARFVATAPTGQHLDGRGLYLIVVASLSRSWVYRFSWRGRRPEMGLGRYPEVGLAEARHLRDEASRALRSGRNPIEERRAAKAADAARQTFGMVADALLESKARELRSKRSLDQWRTSLVEADAGLRELPVDEIDTEAVLSAVKPMWIERPKNADRLRGRIEAVLDAARAAGHRTGENPARWRGHLEHLLPRPPKLARGHHAAMPYHDVPDFLARLRRDDNIGARALEYCILTATRTAETLGARWPEIDLEGKVWTIPAARMKTAREHRVPLSERAVAILEGLVPLRTCEFIFPSPRGPKPLSHVVMQRVLARMEVKGATTHGFRSAFRDWAGNETHAPREIAEAALAHAVGNQVEQAYRRGDALEKRRTLMDAWAQYCESNEVPALSTPPQLQKVR